MDSTPHQISVLKGVPDNYDGVTVTIYEAIVVEVFIQRLRASLSQWREQGKKGVWIKIPLRFAKLVEPAVNEGFRYHHAEPDYVMLVKWISPLPDTIPANASHVVGVAALVLNKSTKEVLVVQERSGYFKDKNVWKLPTGVIDEGEDISTGVVREVKEETGIIAEFVELLAIRQTHQAFLKKKSDIGLLCLLTPHSYDITEQESEILDAKWMPIQDYVDQPFNQSIEHFKLAAEICLKKCMQEYVRFSTVPITSQFGKDSFIFCNADHIKITRDQVSSSSSL